MFVSYQLPQDDFTAVTTDTNAEIAPGVRVAIDPDNGRIDAQPEGTGIGLTFSRVSPYAEWMELAMRLPHPEWQGCGRVWLRFSGQADTEMAVRPALRLIGADGFRDHFAPSPAQLGPDRQVFGSEFTLAPSLMAEVERVDLHLFFTPGNNRVWIGDIGLTGTQ